MDEGNSGGSSLKGCSLFMSHSGHVIGTGTSNQAARGNRGVVSPLHLCDAAFLGEGKGVGGVAISNVNRPCNLRLAL